ncbi:MAG: ribosome maturation factor RimM [Christensenellaceae bacterium]|nr:ribosome maturation factor RimM [Christensenellaceae bacterium]
MKQDKDLLCAGLILKPHGIKGELKIQPLTNTPDLFSSIKKFIISGNEYVVEKARIDDKHVILKLAGLDNRTDADKFRDLELFVDENNRPATNENEYYIADLKQFEITDGLKTYGVLEDILTNGSADVYCVKGDRPFMFPAIRTVVLSTNLEEKTILVSAEELEKVAVYYDN